MSKWLNTINTKPRPRGRTSLSFNTGDVLSLSLLNNNYICSHYNAADLSMLSDFTHFKNELNIINKSFINLGKPLKYEGVNIYIRDTILLAPANTRSLDAIGKLYESD